MSEIVSGVFVLSRIELKELIDLAFFIVKKAADNGIGICMGANAQTLNKYNNADYLPFRLSDDPLDNNCDYLFGGDGISLTVCGNNEPRSESLIARLSKIQKFFTELFATDKVIKVILDINFEFGSDNDSREILVYDFAKTLLCIYQQNDNITPNVQLHIRKA